MTFTLLADVQCLQGKDPERGIPRWTFGFLKALSQLDCRVVALENPRLPKLEGAIYSLCSEVHENTRESVRRNLDILPSVYLVFSPFEPVRPLSALLPMHIADAQIPIVTVMHDLTPYIFPQYYQTDKEQMRTFELKKELFKCSDFFFTNSENTSHDLVALWNVEERKVKTVGSGLPENFYHDVLSKDNLKRIGIDSPYLLCVSRNDPRKQTEKLIEAFSLAKKQVHKDLQLVIACTINQTTEDRWRACVDRFGLQQKDIVITGYISDQDLRGLYSSCDVYIEPSLYEGFGFPAAEAAMCGAVVIASNNSSLPEVIRSEELLFNPHDKNDIVAKIVTAITDSSFRIKSRDHLRNIQKWHNWQSVAARSYEELSVIAKKCSLPERLLGDVGLLHPDSDSDAPPTFLSQLAVSRFYADTQFDCGDRKGTRK